MYSQYGWARIATVSTETRAGQPEFNLAEILSALESIADSEPDVAVFPELALSGYTCADLFHQNTLLNAVEETLNTLLKETADYPVALAVGLPAAVQGQLFNCAAILRKGSLLGVVPKTVIPNYQEFYERRWFASGLQASSDQITLCGQSVPFGTDLLFYSDSIPEYCFGVEICEDLWAPNPPSTNLALQGALLLLNLSASHELAAKSEYRSQLITQQSSRCLAAYAYSSAGPSESSTDMVFGGHCMIAENGRILRESKRFQRGTHWTIADIDLQFLRHERLINHAFQSQIGRSQEPPRRIACEIRDQAGTPTGLKRPLAQLPFVPGDPERRQQRCREILTIQSSGLATRMHNTSIQNLVIGLSGGLDSTLALLAASEACRLLELPLDNIHAYTMPGFGTSEQTRKNVSELAEKMTIKLEEIDIKPACKQLFDDLGHDGETPDAAYENIQARARTQMLMNKANMLQGLVVGTGDLSELALGWCTYAGDQISMYNVNAGVPKTLVSYLIQEAADRLSEEQPEKGEVLRKILATPISPELLPPGEQGEIEQRTEETIGPYQLHDFFLYYLIRCGYPPKKVLILAAAAFAEEYEEEEIRKWLQVFLRRFFSHQFKRSCMPDGPKVGTISLSPRADWRMPSDATADCWLNDLGEAAD